MSLQTILKNKDQYADKLISDFDKIWQKISPRMQRSIASIFRTDLSADEWKLGIQAVLENNGYDALMDEFVTRYSEMARFSNEMAKEIGYKFLITPENVATFDKLNSITLDRLTNKEQYINDMRKFAIEWELEGRRFSQIRSGLETMFDNMGRRLNTEIYTGIRSFESGIDKASFENAGIEKFIYAGPIDDKNRDACQSTLSDPRQQTGWSFDEINASGTPFIERGGWNCRHRWIPFTGD